MRDRRAGPDTFTVLTVCTGNTGRSPMMEHLLRRGFAEHAASGVAVMSAGTCAVPGSRVESGAAKAIHEMGVDASGLTATPVTPALVAASDLVLTATHEHSAEVVKQSPAAVSCTFTLRELVRVIAAVGTRPAASTGLHSADALRRAVAVASHMRESLPGQAPSSDDLADAYGQSEEVYRRQCAEVRACVERIVPYLLGDQAAG
jgi:protein-tyrosine phosphatase